MVKSSTIVNYIIKNGKVKMNNSNVGGFLSILMIVGTIVSWLGSGLLAWDWIDPYSFGTAILFLIAWGFFGKVFDFVLGFIIMGIASLLE